MSGFSETCEIFNLGWGLEKQWNRNSLGSIVVLLDIVIDTPEPFWVIACCQRLQCIIGWQLLTTIDKPNCRLLTTIIMICMCFLYHYCLEENMVFTKWWTMLEYNIIVHIHVCSSLITIWRQHIHVSNWVLNIHWLPFTPLVWVTLLCWILLLLVSSVAFFTHFDWQLSAIINLPTIFISSVYIRGRNCLIIIHHPNCFNHNDLMYHHSRHLIIKVV